MATANPPEDAELEDCEEYRQQKEILSKYFSEIRQKLDEREVELSLQLKNLFREKLRAERIISSDMLQLTNAMEHLKSTLTSNTLRETGNEAIQTIQNKIKKLEKEKMTLNLHLSPQKLCHEIENIGDYIIIPPYNQQKTELLELMQLPLQSGDSWYLIHIQWFNHWSTGDESAKPGRIDNTPLLENGKLRRHQVDEIGYKLVPEEAWNKLVSWYGSVGSEIRRYVVTYGKFVKQCKIEIYPLELKVCVYPRESEFKYVTISRCDTIQTLVSKIRYVYKIGHDKQTRIYNRYMTFTYELIKDLSHEAQDVGLFDGQCVLLEIQNKDGSWPRPAEKRKIILISQ